AVQELIPLRGREPNEAPLQRSWRHGFLVTDNQPSGKDRSIRAVLSLNRSAAGAMHPDAVQERTRAQETVLLDGRPVLRFSQVINRRPNIHAMLGSVHANTSWSLGAASQRPRAGRTAASSC